MSVYPSFSFAFALRVPLDAHIIRTKYHFRWGRPRLNWVESDRRDVGHIPKLRPRGGKDYMDCWDATHVPPHGTGGANPDPNSEDRG